VLSFEENEILSRVGPGTPGGTLLRRYWTPFAASDEIRKKRVKKVRLLGEDLVVYRDLEGRYGLVADKCAHRGAGLEFGIPDKIGLRCCYHGWLYDETGQCRETPLEPATSKLASKVCIKAYPVKELGGLLFAYLGPDPAPLLPRWSLFVWPRSLRQVGSCLIGCNWLQCVENALDLGHSQYLHGHFFKQVLENEGRWTNQGRPTLEMKSSLSNFEWQLQKYGILQRIGRPAIPPHGKAYSGYGPYHIFPYLTYKGGKRIRGEFQIRVPVDDFNTMWFGYQVYSAPPGFDIPEQTSVPHYDVPLKREDGEWILDSIIHQDIHAWTSQGPIADRTRERLGTSDEGIIMYRRLLKEQIDVAARNETPMNVFPSTMENECLQLVPELGTYDAESLFEHTQGYDVDFHDRYGPQMGEVRKLLDAVAASRTAGEKPT
jgi:5,5'-dehydrodivanillate O-demethylase